jgi:hypothetical protein
LRRTSLPFTEEQLAQATAPVTPGGFGFQIFLMARLADFFVAVLGRSVSRPDFVTAVCFSTDELKEALISSIHETPLEGWGKTKRPQQA